MYAVELCFAIEEGSVAPSVEAAAASARNNGHHPEARIEHLRVRRLGTQMYVVAFVTAGRADDAKQLAGTVGRAMSAELRHVRFVSLRVWTGNQLPTEGAQW
jgi:hypothetical protein